MIKYQFVNMIKFSRRATASASRRRPMLALFSFNRQYIRTPENTRTDAIFCRLHSNDSTLSHLAKARDRLSRSNWSSIVRTHPFVIIIYSRSSNCFFLQYSASRTQIITFVFVFIHQINLPTLDRWRLTVITASTPQYFEILSMRLREQENEMLQINEPKTN